MSAPNHHRRVQFGQFVADRMTGERDRRGLRVRLEEQPFQFHDKTFI